MKNIFSLIFTHIPFLLALYSYIVPLKGLSIRFAARLSSACLVPDRLCMDPVCLDPVCSVIRLYRLKNIAKYSKNYEKLQSAQFFIAFYSFLQLVVAFVQLFIYVYSFFAVLSAFVGWKSQQNIAKTTKRCKTQGQTRQFQPSSRLKVAKIG